MAQRGHEVKIILVPDYQECIVWCGGRKISFTCTLPLDREMQWGDLRGDTLDDRPSPQPPSLEPLRPLRQLGKGEWRAAKKRAFGVLQKARGEAMEKLEQAEKEPTFI